MAATLAVGPGAALSHLTGAAFLEIIPARRSGPIELSSTSGTTTRRTGIKLHRRTTLPTITRRGIAVTTPVLTLIDIAPRLPDRKLLAAVTEADIHDLVDPETLRRELEHTPPRPGVRKLRRVLDRPTFALMDSDLERRFLPLARAAGLPLPDTQTREHGDRVDFLWPALGLVVEVDGLRYHRTAQQQADDRRRDQDRTATGLTPLRFTDAQVELEPDHVRTTLERVARRLPYRRGATLSPPSTTSDWPVT